MATPIKPCRGVGNTIQAALDKMANTQLIMQKMQERYQAGGGQPLSYGDLSAILAEVLGDRWVQMPENERNETVVSLAQGSGIPTAGIELGFGEQDVQQMQPQVPAQPSPQAMPQGQMR